MILPLRKETYVTSARATDIRDLLKRATGPNRSDISRDKDKIFIGQVREADFQITRRLDRPENFMPQINGKIESTSSGSIVFLRYTLQFSSRMFVVFWTITTLLFALFLWFIQTNMKLGYISLAVLLLNILVTHVNFQRQYSKSREVLWELMNEANN